VIGLAATAWGVFSPAVLEHYSDSPDSVGIAWWVKRAGPPEMLGWWTGRWIQEDSPPYYRPLASFLFWAEYRLFGMDFQGHVVVSWLLHAAVCACVWLLAFRLYPGSHRLRVLTALLAVVLVNVRLGPVGPYWQAAPVAYAVVAWWPAQTDQMSLLLSLLSLLALDRWLRGEDGRGLLKAAGLWLGALLFKEMAVILPLLGWLLVVYRRGLGGGAPADGAAERGRAARLLRSPWTLGLCAVALCLAYLALRSAMVPLGAATWQHTPGYYLHKAVLLLAERPRTLLAVADRWVLWAGALWGLGIALWLRAARRPDPVWSVLGMVLATVLLAQVVGGNFALATIPTELGKVGTLALLALGVLVLAQVREAWPWLLLAMVPVVHVPLIGVWGPHYFYWPAAFWGLFNAGLWHYALKRWPLRARHP